MIVAQSLAIPPDHPALAGHFPGDPMVPGSLLLDEAAALALKCSGRHVTGVRMARFKTPLRPGEDCEIRLSEREDGALDLTCRVGQKTVMTAILECEAGDRIS